MDHCPLSQLRPTTVSIAATRTVEKLQSRRKDASMRKTTPPRIIEKPMLFAYFCSEWSRCLNRMLTSELCSCLSFTFGIHSRAKLLFSFSTNATIVSLENKLPMIILHETVHQPICFHSNSRGAVFWDGVKFPRRRGTRIIKNQHLLYTSVPHGHSVSTECSLLNFDHVFHSHSKVVIN